jgi:hopene-associated glycosyltransferase HpnB
LFLAHGRFWLSRPELPPDSPLQTPGVDIVVPARDEAPTIGPVIASLLAQNYRGPFRIILVDDNSSDGTGEHAGDAPNLRIIRGRPKPSGWAGKMWALSQGVAAGDAPLLFFTDADIIHDPRHLSALVAGLREHSMVSEMVRLNCESVAERALVPAFVYFFQMLYPFALVNSSRSRTAAAAGGTILIRREALESAGGIEAIKAALIDDVALAAAVKAQGSNSIYLGHSALAASIRPYPKFADIWRMIARSAFTQLRFSAAMLLVTVGALTLVWLVPVWAAIFGRPWERAGGIAACVLAAVSYVPTLRRYGRTSLWVFALPLIALFYLGATVGSAIDHWRGAGTRWKNRSYG